MELTIANNILLRNISQEYAEDIFKTINSQRSYLREWLPFIDKTTDLIDTVSYIESVENAHYEQKDEVFVILCDGKFAGIIGFKLTDKDNMKTEIGYWLSDEMQGKGIVTRSCKELLRYAFVELNLNRVQIKTAVGNHKSKRIPKKLGFKFEGIERDGELLNCGFTDIEVYSLLRSEFTYP